MYQELACLFWAGMWGSHESTSGHTPGGRVEVVLELCRLDIFQGLVGYLFEKSSRWRPSESNGTF